MKLGTLPVLSCFALLLAKARAEEGPVASHGGYLLIQAHL